MVNLLGQLHAADVLLCDVPPDTAELFRRHTKQEKSWWQTNLRSPLSLRFPLFKPEKFLARTAYLVRPLFSIYGALLWLAVVGAALVLAGLNWQDLTEGCDGPRPVGQEPAAPVAGLPPDQSPA